VTTRTEDADVVVVGAGPAGATTAYHLASSGLDVVLLEKTSFPREKVCGDGLTPRAVRELLALGIEPTPGNGWIRNRGLRILGGGMRLELPWPDLATYPGYGLVRTRLDFDEILARQASKAGARLHERTAATEPVLDPVGRIVGVRARTVEADGSKGADAQFRAPLVVAADGNSTRLSLAMGLRKRDDRPMGVAVRTYYRSPRDKDDWLESWLELWQEHDDGRRSLLPGYGWIFGVGDGTANVGLGILNSSAAFGKVDYRDLLHRWVASTPEEWGLREHNRTEPVRGAALPMGFNRTPQYTRGLLLVGDAGGMVNPFNGEGIAYAMESGRMAADVIVQAHGRPSAAARELALEAYPAALKQTYGGYYTLGRMFVKLIGHPEVMKLATRHGLPHPSLMRFTLKLLANLTDPHDGDAMDRIINAMTKVAPAA
jgi:geranylgeranyl reductase family protein